MATRELQTKAKRWVVKIGSSLVTADGAGIDHQAIQSWAAQCAAIYAQDIEVVLVCSGAVAEGLARLGWEQRPAELERLQAAASVGQMGLIQVWERGFLEHNITTAQVLLTHDDLADRSRYLNARNSLRCLLDVGVVPIVNENDTVAIEELRLGDNDTLGALVVDLVDADMLVILTDQQGLFDSDPRHNPGAKLIDSGAANAPEFMQMASGGAGNLGRGGMRTKVLAAQKAARAGAATVIASGKETDVLLRLRQGEALGTLLTATHKPLASRKQWIANQVAQIGVVTLDEGTCAVVKAGGKSLLPIGVQQVTGDFNRGDVVDIADASGAIIAKGVSNYNADEARKIAGHASDKIADILGYCQQQELIHYDDMVAL